MSRFNVFSDLLRMPPVRSASGLWLSPYLVEIILQIVRQPHRYGFAFVAFGTAPHLSDDAGGAHFDAVMRSDAFAFDSRLALEVCLYELVERVWSAAPSRVALRDVPFRDLRESALNPAEFALLSDTERARVAKRFVAYGDALPLDWVEAWALSSQGALRSRHIPALLVYPRYGQRHPRQRFVPMLSTGVAAGRRYDEAIFRGLCEVVERDAFAVSWLCELAPPRVAGSAALLGPAARAACDALGADGFAVTFFDLTLDIPIPVVLAAVTNSRRQERPAVVLGLGCHPHPAEAVEKAIREALLLMVSEFDFGGGKLLRRNGADKVDTAESDAVLARFLGRTDQATLDRHAGSMRHRTPGMPHAFLDALSRVTGAGHEPYFCDLTPNTGEQADFVIVRVLVPRLQPHLYEPDCWRLANRRLFELPRCLGRSGPSTEAELNLAINPFARHADK